MNTRSIYVTEPMEDADCSKPSIAGIVSDISEHELM